MAVQRTYKLSATAMLDIARDLNELGKAFGDDSITYQVRQSVGEVLLEALNTYISQISSFDGNTKPSSTDIKNLNDLLYIRWMGEQVAYLEFGTGIVAIESAGYGNPSVMAEANYEWQQYHGTTQSESWFYPDESGGATLTFGNEPQMPMWKVSVDADKIIRAGGLKSVVGKAIDQVIRQVIPRA